MRQPSLFISHGTPMTVLQEDDYTAALARYARRVAKPKAVLVVSAHTCSPDGTVTVATPTAPSTAHELYYDFGGFPKELYKVQYPAQSAPELQSAVMGHLATQAFRAIPLKQRLDHGVWVPLKLMYPEADVPVIHLSLPFPTQPEKALLLGKALAPLREEGVMILGSGSMVHNLGELVWSGKSAAPVQWAAEFESWMRQKLVSKDVTAIVQFKDEEYGAPHADRAHPTEEHFFPLLVTLGAALPGDQLEFIYEGIEYTSLSMTSFALGRHDAEKAEPVSKTLKVVH